MKRTAKHRTRSAAGPGAGGVAVATRTFNFVLPSGETERRDTYAQFPSASERDAFETMRKASESELNARRSECNAVTAYLTRSGPNMLTIKTIRANEKVRMHGCARCATAFAYEGATPDAVMELIDSSPDLLRCPQCDAAGDAALPPQQVL